MHREEVLVEHKEVMGWFYCTGQEEVLVVAARSFSADGCREAAGQTSPA